jgi:hypothetical protein
MKQLILCAVVVFTALPVMGAETFTDVYTFGSNGIIWDSERTSWADNPTVDWTHELTGFDSSYEVTSATLTIDGSGIENVWWDTDLDGGYEQMDWVTVSLNGVELGQMGSNIYSFDLVSAGLDITSVMQGNAEITFQNDLIDLSCFTIDWDWQDAIQLNTSTLSVTVGDLSSSPVTPAVVVPVPGAFLLAGFGTLLVGTLRRRQKI